jgi:predicted dehydrogenase
MRLLWRTQWLAAPDYDVPSEGVALLVEASIPLVHLKHASGRVITHPTRKLLRFLLTDGPRATLAKARTKLTEERYFGDYWITLILGEREDHGAAAVALACRAPRCAHRMVTHSSLVSTLAEPWTTARLAAAARALRDAPTLGDFGDESYLYSSLGPPAPLIALFRSAIAQAPVTLAGDADVLPAIKPPHRSPSAGPAMEWHRPGHIRPAERSVPVALLGTGDYARTQIIPALKRSDFALLAVADREAQIVAQVAAEHAVPVMTTRAIDAINALPAGGLVIVATAHDSHATLAAAALERDLLVFVEKPPVVTEDDLRLFLTRCADTPERVDIGFNRRYHLFSVRARQLLATETGPVTIVCTVKEVRLEPNHWYFWPNQGTRVTGNLCHWIDLGVFLMGGSRVAHRIALSPPVATGHGPPDEERVLSVAFDDGSLLTIMATGRGDDTLGVQEVIEARRGGVTIRIDDFRRMSILARGRRHAVRTLWRDKGHARMYSDGLKALVRGRPRYPARDLALVSSIQITASELLTRSVTAADVGSRLHDLARLA